MDVRPKFAADASLLVAETALLFLASTVQPITTGGSAWTRPRSGASTGRAPGVRGQIGAAMVAAALSYTGFVTLLAAIISARAPPPRPRRPAHGTRGRVVVQVRARRRGGAPAHERRRRRCSATSGIGAAFSSAPSEEQNEHAEGRTRPRLNACNAFRRREQEQRRGVRKSPGAIDDEKVFEKVSSAGRSEKEKKPFNRNTPSGVESSRDVSRMYARGCERRRARASFERPSAARDRATREIRRARGRDVQSNQTTRTFSGAAAKSTRQEVISPFFKTERALRLARGRCRPPGVSSASASPSCLAHPCDVGDLASRRVRALR